MKKNTKRFHPWFLLLFLLGVVCDAEQALSKQTASQYTEFGTPRYRIHDLSTLGSGYRSIQMARDDYGRLLITSGGTLWSFDGTSWNQVYTVNERDNALVGLDSSNDNTLYAGANGNWGYLESNEKGNYHFVSCKDLNNSNHTSIQEDVFNVKHFGKVTGFMGNYSIVLMDENHQSRLYDGFYRLTTQFDLKGEIYVCSEREGICHFRDGEMIPLDHLIFKDAAFITASYRWDENRILLGMSNGGIYIFDGETVQLMDIKVPEASQNRINDLLLIEDQYICMSLDGWGLLIVDLEGNYVNSVTQENDQRFLNATTLNYNSDGCLWVSVASGLAQVFFPSPLVIFDHSQGFVMSWPSVYRYHGKLVLRSNRTIFEGVYDDDDVLSHFQKMDLPVGNRAVDAILPIDDGVIYGDQTGIYIKKYNGDVHEIAKGVTTHYLQLHPENPEMMFSFNSRGIYLFRKEGGEWNYTGDFLEVEGANNQVFYIDREHWFWTERGIGKVVRFKIKDDRLVGRIFTKDDGMGTTWVGMYELENNIYVRTEHGHHVYNFETKAFEVSPEMNQIEEEIGITITRPKTLTDDEWFIPTVNGLVLMKINLDGSRSYDFNTFGTLAEYNPMILNTIKNEIWMRTQNTLIKYNPSIARRMPTTKTYIQMVEVPGINEMRFSSRSIEDTNKEDVHIFNYHKNGLNFYYFSPSFDRIHPLKHRFFLEGFSTEWSDLTPSANTMFMGLREGRYTFVVEAVDHMDHPGEQSRFSFIIRPPWYRTIVAYASYLIGLCCLIFLIVVYNRKSMVEENHRLEALINERTASLRKTAEKAEAATIAKSQFLANMSHEIRTPINGIIGSSELMASGKLEKEQSELLRMIQSSSSSLIGLVEGILDFSRIEANRVELKERKFDLEAVILDCLNVVSNLSHKKRIELFYTLDPSINPCFIGDHNRIRQILVNLLSNAIKFTHEGYVHLQCCVIEQTNEVCVLQFTVQDTGVGIDLESSGDLFEPFHQVDNSNTRNYGGTGLGLAICKQLVVLMGGEIGIKSQLNEGTTIECSIQLKVAEKEERISPQYSEQTRFMVIDSLDSRRLTWKQFFQHHNHDCSDSNNVEYGLEMLSSGPFCNYVLVEYHDSPIYLDLCEKLFELKREKLIKDFIVFAFPDMFFPKHLRQYVRKKPYAYNEIYLELLAPPKLHPSKTNERAEQTDTSELRQMDRLKGLRVLTVEDNSVNHRVISLILNRAGVETEQAWNGQEAVELTSKKNYDVVLMDVQMPIMDGIQATKIIKSRENPPLIIGVTANAQEADRQQAMDVQMDGYLTKPVRKKVLLDCLEHLVKAEST